MKKFYTTVDGKFYACDENGTTDKSVELTSEEIKSYTEFQSVDGAMNELKSFIEDQVKSVVGDTVKNINSIKTIEESIKNEFAKAFKGEDTSVKFYGLDAEGNPTKAMTSEDVLKGLKSVKGESKASFSFFVDGIKTISELNSLTGEVILEDRQAGVDKAPVRREVISDLVDTTPTNSNAVSYVEVLTESGAPATTAELALIPQKDYTFGVQEAKVLKIAVANKTSVEMLEDAPQLIAQIRNWLMEDMKLKAEDKMLSGAGTTGEFTGVITVAPAFTSVVISGHPFYHTVEKANNFDVLKTAIGVIMASSKMNYYPNAILVNPLDATLLELTKDDNGQYVLPPFITADKTVVSGVRIIPTSAISAGDFLVGDFKRAHKAVRRGLGIQIATENEDDFLRDIITVKLTERFAFYIKTNDVGAFLKGNFTTALSAIAYTS